MIDTVVADDLLIAGAERGDVIVKESRFTTMDEMGTQRRLYSRMTLFMLALVGAIAATTVWSYYGFYFDHSGVNKQTEESKPAVVIQSNGLLFHDVSLERFNPSIVKGYNNNVELKNDLINVMKFHLNDVAAKNVADTEFGSMMGTNNGGWAVESNDRKLRDSNHKHRRRLDKEDSSYHTNNLKSGVEEGDMIVSNGQTVYGVYGSYIVAWNATSGNIMFQEELPTVTSVEYNYTYSSQIQNLVLHDDRLLVISYGYGGSGYKAVTGREYPILNAYKDTRVFLYSITSTGNLTLIYSKYLNGYYSDVRVVNGEAYIVTSSGIDIYTDLIPPQNFTNTSDPQYWEDMQDFTEQAIPKFVDELLEELTDDSSMIPNLFRFSLFVSHITNETLNQSIYFDSNILSSIAFVHSFDMSTSDPNAIQISTSGAFFPSGGTTVYGSKDKLILGMQTYDMNVSTYLLAFDLKNGTAIPYSTGMVRGTVVNGQSVDIIGNVLRVATVVETIEYEYPTTNGTDDDEGGYPVYCGPAIANDTNETFYDSPPKDYGENATSSSDNISYFPPPPYYTENQTDMNYPIECPPPIEYTYNRTTENYITLLDISNGNMTVLGQIQLGQPQETLRSVRFFNDMAYAVTFNTVGSLFVLNLTNPTRPTVATTMQYLGYPDSLSPLNDNGTVYLSIGSQTDVNGTDMGLEISVLDLTVLDDIKVTKRSFIETNNGTTWTGSDARWNYHSIRYVHGKLMIPLDIDNYDDPNAQFHGIAVFAADTNGITDVCRITSGEPTTRPAPIPYGTNSTDPIPPNWPYNTSYVPFANDTSLSPSQTIPTNETDITYPSPSICYSCGSLSRRAMMFEGKLVTTDNNVIQSTNIETCQQEWKTKIRIMSNTNGDCCSY